MVLTTHAVVGAAVASTMPNHPVLGFLAGFASHFLLDAIPHWDYTLETVKAEDNDKMKMDMQFNDRSHFDFFKIGADILLGGLIALFLFSPTEKVFSTALLGAFGGILPDGLQFAHWKIRREPFILIYRFHLWIHSKRSLNSKPFLGATLQIILIIICVIVFGNL